MYCALSPEVLEHGGEHYADCKIETDYVHAMASDEKLQQDLWKASEDIVNGKA